MRLSAEFWRSFGELFLYATMRSWFAVFWNTGFVAAWFLWNGFGPPRFWIDPYPYSFLCTMLTALSYLEGPVIITMAWQAERAQKRNEALLMQLVKQNLKAQVYQVHLTEAVYAILTGSPMEGGLAPAQAAGTDVLAEEAGEFHA